MKLGYKGLDMDFNKEEGNIAIDVLTKLFGDEFSNQSKKDVSPINEETKNFPFSEEEFLKYQEQQKELMDKKDWTIADLTNKLNQALSNYKASKEINMRQSEELEVLRANHEGKVDANQAIIDKMRSEAIEIKASNVEKTNKIDQLRTELKQKEDEIASLQRKIKELELKPNEYSSTMTAALVKANLIPEEEHKELENNIVMGRDVKTYWDDFETYVDSYSPSPILVTDFGKFSVVNCTPHDVVLEGSYGVITVPPSEVCTRLEMDHKDVQLDNSDVPLVVESKGKLINVPVRKDKTLYIVSRIVFDVSVDREDFICPNIMKAKRSGKTVQSVPNFICRKGLLEKYNK